MLRRAGRGALRRLAVSLGPDVAVVLCAIGHVHSRHDAPNVGRARVSPRPSLYSGHLRAESSANHAGRRHVRACDRRCRILLQRRGCGVREMVPAGRAAAVRGWILRQQRQAALLELR